MGGFTDGTGVAEECRKRDSENVGRPQSEEGERIRHYPRQGGDDRNKCAGGADEQSSDGFCCGLVETSGEFGTLLVSENRTLSRFFQSRLERSNCGEVALLRT